MKNQTLLLEQESVHTASFGRGPKHLVILSGIGDALKSVKGMALPLSFMYRIFKDDFTVTFISRKITKTSQTTKDMAIDLKRTLDLLKIEKCSLLGVSMGGMIAQHFAALYPQTLEKLVLVSTSSRPNKVLDETIDEWVFHLKEDEYLSFMDSNLKRIYQKSYYSKNKFLIPFVSFFTKPVHYDFFLMHAKACKEHNAYDVLKDIQAKTLIIGGKKDECLDYQESVILHENIKDSILYTYEHLGHGLYDEAKDFNERVLNFLKD